MLAGAAINVTEHRAVLHTALRAPRGKAPFSDDVHVVLDAMLGFAESVRSPGGLLPLLEGDVDGPGPRLDASTAGLLRRLRGPT